MLDPSRREPDRPPRLARAAAVCGASGKLCPAERATQLLEAIIEPGDRVAIEGDNQKQADFLAAALAKASLTGVRTLTPSLTHVEPELTTAAAEAAVGLGIILAFYRNKETVNIDEMNLMKW